MPVGPELEHFYGVAVVEVEEFVAGEGVHFGEGAGFEEVVDGGAHGSRHWFWTALQFNVAGGGVGAAEEAALVGVGFEVEEGFDFGGGELRGHGHYAIALEDGSR